MTDSSMTDRPMTDNCNVVFRGDIAPGFTLVEVRQGLKDFFSLDDARVSQLFSGRPVTIKKNVTRDKADQFKTLLAGMGAVAEIVAVDDSVTDSPAAATTPAAPVTAPAPVVASDNAEEPTSAADMDTITIAPAGADVLKPEERSAIPHREIVTDHLSVDSPGADVLKPHERKKAVEVHIDLSHLRLEPTDDATNATN